MSTMYRQLPTLHAHLQATRKLLSFLTNNASYSTAVTDTMHAHRAYHSRDSYDLIGVISLLLNMSLMYHLIYEPEMIHYVKGIQI